MSTRAETIAHLTRTLEATEPLFRSSPKVLGTAYAPGKWTLHQLLVHLADHESLVIDRLRRTAFDPEPVLYNYDTDGWANGLDYAHRSITAAGQLFAGARRSVIDLLTILPPEADTRVAVHSTLGRMTLLDVCGTWRHNEHHLQQAQAIVLGRTWPPTRA
jgi:hypothetical protein